MPNTNVLEFDHLEHVVEVLNRGDWRSAKEALLRGVDAGQRESVVGVQVCLRRVCRCMWLQCALGDVESAHRELERARTVLVQLGVRTAADGGLLLPARPARKQRVQYLVWSATRLVARETADLAAVRAIFGDIGRGRPELVHACVEHLTWIEFDPWTVRMHVRDQELLDIDDDAYARFRTVNPMDISARATNLRHFAAVRTGSVSRRTWNRLGGHAAVREAALLVLAGEPVTRGRTDCPLRLGRLRAWEYARRLRDDTAA
jgi:hypothetical protein